MNLKILIFPLLIFAIIVFSIWFLYPAYLKLEVTRGELDKANENLANINQKIQTAERLSEEVANNQEYQKILASLLPSEKSEEQIVNELNNLVFTQGMVVYEISFENEKIKSEEALVPVLDESGNPLIDPVTGQYTYGETIPKIKNVQTKAGAIGDYDKIKGFLRKMTNLKRFNNIASIKMFKGLTETTSLESEGDASNGILKMDVVTDFSYLEKVKDTIDVNDGIFTSGQFNLSVLDEIWKNKNTVTPELKTDSQGASNPFVL